MEKKPEINLIDREAAAEILDARAEMAVGTPGIAFNAAAKMIRMLPAIDAAPVRRGRWVADILDMLTGETKTVPYDGQHGIAYCSECKEPALSDGYEADFESNYCPNCGAKMDLEE